MKRSAKDRHAYDEDSHVPVKKSLPASAFTEEVASAERVEYSTAEGEDLDVAMAMNRGTRHRAIRIIQRNSAFKSRVVPPWTLRAKQRYANEITEILYNNRDGVEESYAIADTTGAQMAESEVILRPPGVVVKSDIDEDEQEIVVDDVVAEEAKSRRPIHRTRNSTRQAAISVANAAQNAVASAEEQQIAGAEAQDPSLYAYEIVDSSGAVVDNDLEYQYYGQYHEDVASLFVVGSEVMKQNYSTTDDITQMLMSNAHLSHPIDVRELVSMSKVASPDTNYQLISGLAGLVNAMRREMSTMRVEINSLRDIVTSKQDVGMTKRRFSTMNSVRHQWRIQAQPPLREVDLIHAARSIDFTRGTKKTLSNKDAIGRFVKAILELLIPEEHTKLYTVRERTHRRNGLKDIGDHAKDQITGCVLDFMGLYDMDELDEQSRADRAYFSNIVAQAMRMSLIDLRRTEPRRLLTNSTDYTPQTSE